MYYTIRIAPWAEIGAAARAIRETVFIIEQKIPQALEWDGIDADCVTALALDQSGVPVGTGRLLPDGRIGRMAVLAEARGTGAGRALLEELMAEARRRGFTRTALSAQTSAKAFYEKSGFAADGAEYMEDGILHIMMRRTL